MRLRETYVGGGLKRRRWLINRILNLYCCMDVIVVALYARYVYFTRMCRREFLMLRQFERFLSLFYNHYSIYEDVEECFLYTLDLSTGDIYERMDEIYQLLREEEMEQIRQYKWNSPLSCFTSFLHLCFCMEHYGGGEENSKRAFLETLMTLKKQVCYDILKRERWSHSFFGIVPMILVPICSLYSIRCWGVSSLQELAPYYNEMYGKISAIFILLSCMCCYEVVLLLRDDMKNTAGINRFIVWMMSRKCVAFWMERFLYHCPNYVFRIEKLLRKAMVPWDVATYCLQKILYGIGGASISMILLWMPSVHNKDYEWMMEIFIVVVVSIVFFEYPMFRLKILAFKMREERDNEIMRFLSLFRILSKTKSADITFVLECFEAGSIYFEQPLQVCLDNYLYEFEDAMKRLKEQESNERFGKIIESLQFSEKIGLEKTFESLEEELVDFLEEKKQENEMNIENMGALAKCIAFIPMVLTIGLYVVVPFVLQSLVELGGFVEQMGKLS